MSLSPLLPVPVAARYKAWVCGHSLIGAVGSNPAGGVDAVSCECRVLSGRGLCVGLITRPGGSYLGWCMSLSVIRCSNMILHLQ